MSISVVFYRSAAGNEPVRDWLRSVPKGLRQVIGEDIAYVELNWPIGKPHVDAFGKGLWEVRSTYLKVEYRVMFCVIDGQMVLLHHFEKHNEGGTPTSEKVIGYRRMREVKG